MEIPVKMKGYQNDDTRQIAESSNIYNGNQRINEAKGIIYPRINEEFRKILKSITLDQRKEEIIRGKITLNSFRRFARTTVADQTNTDYAEWFIGHSGSTYWRKKPEEKADVYKTKCMQALTFLDFSKLEETGKNMEVRMDAKERQIQSLMQEISELKERESLARIDMDDMRKITREINEKFKKVENDLHWSPNTSDEMDAYLDYRDTLPFRLEIHKIPFSLMGKVLKRINRLGWGDP